MSPFPSGSDLVANPQLDLLLEQAKGLWRARVEIVVQLCASSVRDCTSSVILALRELLTPRPPPVGPEKHGPPLAFPSPTQGQAGMNECTQEATLPHYPTIMPRLVCTPHRIYHDARGTPC